MTSRTRSKPVLYKDLQFMKGSEYSETEEMYDSDSDTDFSRDSISDDDDPDVLSPKDEIIKRQQEMIKKQKSVIDQALVEIDRLRKELQPRIQMFGCIPYGGPNIVFNTEGHYKTPVSFGTLLTQPKSLKRKFGQ